MMASLADIRAQLERLKEGHAALRAALQSLAHAHEQEQHAFIKTTISEHNDARLLFRDLRVLNAQHSCTTCAKLN